jgi:hypothetical protein
MCVCLGHLFTTTYLRLLEKSCSYDTYCYAPLDILYKGLYVHQKSLRMAFWDILFGAFKYIIQPF